MFDAFLVQYAVRVAVSFHASLSFSTSHGLASEYPFVPIRFSSILTGKGDRLHYGIPNLRFVDHSSDSWLLASQPVHI